MHRGRQVCRPARPTATREQAQAWKRVEAVIERFKSADWYLFSLPMWNFGIP
ncbi:MAG: NAD(P)H-dependent oxidoreductase [Verrucomicrobia bacterium]|nr:NAD(P)H-dependent oxidoreductase [Verrucomicrobiota bacterium]